MTNTGKSIRSVILVTTLGCIGVASFIVWGHSASQVTIDSNSDGLHSLKYNGVDLLGFGDLRVERVLIKHANGDTAEAPTTSTLQVNAGRNEMSRKFPWGSVAAKYAVRGNRLDISVTTNNTSRDTIAAVFYEPIGLRLPTKAREYDGNVPLVGHNVGNPTSITMSYGSGMVVLVNDDVIKPLLIGFPWALDKPKNTFFPLRLNTGRDPRLPDMLPFIDRPIPPGSSDEYTVSLRFGPADANPVKLADDVLHKFSAAFPSEIKWKDRRPIGTLILATFATGWQKNPRGWFLDPNLDVTTPDGRADFKQRLLKLADSSIAILRDMNAQGMITWDIEGQEHPKATYAGDPRLFSMLAPEMTDAADEYFKRFRDAGFRVGVCVRPQEVVTENRQNIYERAASDPGEVLAQKIRWAKQRWGATLFYIDSNGDSSRPLDASVIQKLASAFPDVLLVPEHKNLKYFAYSAPYFDLKEGTAATPGLVRTVYPNAFSLVNTADGELKKRHDDLIAAVKQGDVLLYRSWYVDPANADVKSLYY